MRRFIWPVAALLLFAATLVGCSATRLGRGERCLPAQPTATPSVVPAGGQVTLSSSGFGGCDSYAEPVDYLVVFGTGGRLPPTALATITAAADGSFSAVVTIPPETTLGEGYFSLSGSKWDECDDSASCVGYGAMILVSAPAQTVS